MARVGARCSAWFAVASMALAAAVGSSPAAAATIGQLPPVDPPTNSCGHSFDLVQPTVTDGTSYVVPSTGGIANWTVTSWSTKSSSPGQSMALKMFRKAGTPNVFEAIAHEGPHTLVGGVNSFPAHLQVQAGDILGIYSTAGSCVFNAPGEAFFYLQDVNLADGQQGSFTPDTDFRVNASAQVEPTSDIKLGKAKSKSNGSAILPVTVENPGVLTASGGGIAKISTSATESKQVKAAGTVKLKIKAKGLKSRQLKRKGKVKVDPKITFTPTGGIPNSVFRKIKLHRG